MNDSLETTSDDLIDLGKFVKFIKALIYKVFFVLIIIWGLGIFYISNIPNEYTSIALLETNKDNIQTSSAGSSGFGGALLGAAGISFNNSLKSSDYIVSKLKSREFFKLLINENPSFLHKIYAAESYNFYNDQIIYNDLYSINKNTWNGIAPSVLKVYQYGYLKRISISVDKKSGLITISFQHPSPFFAKEFIDVLVTFLNNNTRSKDIEESNSALEYLKIQDQETKNFAISQAINSLIQDKLQTKMFANIKEDYLLSYIDPPFIPEMKSYPRRTFYAFLIVVISTSISFLFITSLYYIRTLKKEV